jgi:hypothetical protein
LVAAVVHKDCLHWISAGDSRLYLFRNASLTCLTTDHNYLNELYKEVADGKISTEEAENHPNRNALTSFLGEENIRMIDQNSEPFSLQEGDRVMVCSDGLYGTLTHNEILSCLVKNSEPHSASEDLIKEVLKKNRQCQDNTTLAILGCETETTNIVSTVPSAPKPKERTVFRKFLLGALVLLILTVTWILLQPTPENQEPRPETPLSTEAPPNNQESDLFSPLLKNPAIKEKLALEKSEKISQKKISTEDIKEPVPAAKVNVSQQEKESEKTIEKNPG